MICVVYCIIFTMQQANFSGQKLFGNKKVKIETSVLLFEEDNLSYAYMPSMDLTGYGKNQQEAFESLKTTVDEFLKYSLNKNTLLVELKRLGWKIKSKKKLFHAPAISDLINTNDQLREIVDSKNYRTSSYEVNVPAFA